MATCLERQNTISHFDGNIFRTNRWVKDVPHSKFIAKCGATSIRACVCKSSRQSCKRSKLSRLSGCFVLVWRKEFFFMRLDQSFKIISNRIMFVPAPVSKRQTAVYMTVVTISYETRSLYVGQAVRATYVGTGESSGSLRLCTAFCFGRCVVGV